MPKPEIREYAVELRLTNPNTGAREVVTRHEYAYTMPDAAMQAHLAVSLEAGSAKIELVSIGPPKEAILAASDASDQVASALAKLLDDALKNGAPLVRPYAKP